MSVLIQNGRDSVRVSVSAGTRLLDALHAGGIFPALPCGGNGRCGQCAVFASGLLSPPGDEERALLGERLASGMRLACFTHILGDCTVRCPFGFAAERTVFPLPPSSAPTVPPLPAPSPFAAESRSGVGLAVDIGTTTVEGAWYDLVTGRCLAHACAPNTQRLYGADVVTRLSYAQKNGSAQLTEAIRTLLRDLIASNDLPADVFAFTGNTVMLHLLCGLPVSGFFAMPFTPESLFGVVRSYEGKPVLLCPAVSAFVGADTVCAVLAGGLCAIRSPAVLLDLGTNGEIAYWSGEHLLCCSAAAGPAFEGSGLSCGMPALPGAVCGVGGRGTEAEIETVEHEAACGICGSGIIDLLAYLRRCGILDAGGYLAEPYVLPGTSLSVTPADIRQVQLAKAAVAAALTCVSAGRPEPLRFQLAGAFGQYLPVQSAVRIGLLPRCAARRCELLGNAALYGAARAMLFDGDFSTLCRLSSQAETLALGGNHAFSDAFINRMTLEPFDYGEE